MGELLHVAAMLFRCVLLFYMLLNQYGFGMGRPAILF